jgi:hypothetical protein
VPERFFIFLTKGMVHNIYTIPAKLSAEETHCIENNGKTGTTYRIKTG